MATAGDHLAPLSAPEREKLESWLVDFDLAWTEDLLARQIQQLPPKDRLRVPALIEMVKIDLERRWQRGRQVLLEPYLRAYPELASAEGALAVLIRAECDVRAQFGTPPAPSELLRRFPNQAAAIRQLGAPPAASRPDARRSAPAARETVHSAASTPSVAAGSGSARALPEQFGARYRIVKKLGRGGMGTVYLAKDTQLDRPVALKVPHFEPDDGPEVLQRFYQEARIAATLDHPNICPIYDVGEVGGVPYLTMKCIVGKPLTDFIRADRPLPPVQAAALVRKLALALQAAHARGIVHRDLKPSNIMIHQGGEPVVMDFGLAARPYREGSARLTRTGTPLGTPAYMAPEQVRGDTHGLGPACDVYSLGVVLYELLTGRPPFEGPVYAVLALVLTQEPPPPSQLRPGLDPQLEAVCKKAMAKKPEDRYATMAEFAEALAVCLRKRSPAPPKSQRRLPVALLGVAGGALLAVLLLLVVVVVLALPRGAGPGKTQPDSPLVVAPPTQPQATAAATLRTPPAPPPVVSTPAAAEPSLEKYLPDDASAVFVLNVRQILDAPLIKKSALAKLQEGLKTVPAEVRFMLNALQLDPLQDIATIIVANTGTPNQDRGLIIVQGKFHPDKVQDLLETLRNNAAKDEYELTSTEVPDATGDKYQLFALKALKAQPAPVTMYFAPVQGSLFVLSPQQEQVVEALAKAGGRRKTALKDESLGRFLASADRGESAWVFMRPDVVNLLKQSLGAAGLDLEDTGLNELGSAHGGLTLKEDVRGKLVLDFKTVEAAEKLAKSVREGLGKQKQVLAEKAGQDKGALQNLEFLNSIQVIQTGATVTFQLHLTADVAEKLFADSALWEKPAAVAGKEGPPDAPRANVAPGTDGKEFSPKGEGFSISMPGSPRRKTEQTDSPVGKLESVSYEATTAQAHYGVSYVDYPKSLVETGLVNTMLNGARDGMLETSKAKLVQEEKIKLKEYQGRDLLVEAPGGKSYLRTRLYLVKQRLYMIMTEGSKAQVTGDAAKKFLDSFKLVPE